MIYNGVHNGSDRWYEVTKDGGRFDTAPSLKLRNHSPDGFSWGYNGSGSVQFALAILLDHTDKFTACRLYDEYKDEVVSRLPTAKFELTSDQVIEWLASKGVTFKKN